MFIGVAYLQGRHLWNYLQTFPDTTPPRNSPNVSKHEVPNNFCPWGLTMVIDMAYLQGRHPWTQPPTPETAPMTHKVQK